MRFLQYSFSRLHPYVRRVVLVVVALLVIVAAIPIVQSIVPAVAVRTLPAPERTARLPDDLQPWWQQFQKEFIVNIDQISDDSVNQAAVAAKSAGYSAAHDHDGNQVRAYLRTFVSTDLEPFLATLLSGLPEDLQDRVNYRMRAQEAPVVIVEFSDSYYARISMDRLNLYLSTPTLEAYEDWRDTLAHEMVHYLVQGDFSTSLQKMDGPNFLAEATTEYWTVKTGQLLGWPYTPSSYEEEVLTFSLLASLAERDIAEWYLADAWNSDDDTELRTTLCRHLQAHGVSRAQAGQLVGSWQYRALTRLTDRSLGDISLWLEAEKLQGRTTLQLSIIRDKLEERDRAYGFMSLVEQCCTAEGFVVPMHSECAQQLLAEKPQSLFESLDYPEYFLVDIFPALQVGLLGKRESKGVSPTQRSLIKLASQIEDAESYAVFHKAVLEAIRQGAVEDTRDNFAVVKALSDEADRKVDAYKHSLVMAERKKPHWLLLKALHGGGADVESLQRKAHVPRPVRKVISDDLKQL